ncbi:EAL domain-containing protein [Mesorhizobium sp. YIM 152430]|uniref:sensor domain-containing phosphodiesterase n=1 Tax=Mesorhizobium sp. YIM 152430 TaxID=3031761 RepID=UPI0023DC1A0C|nr:EAL domain-containing protein [Mesorhizobium sp. YIM 152430]MDF1598759.1 EAL domain-containing protein [Mesorhizobium sp. YIM 152430]
MKILDEAMRNMADHNAAGNEIIQKALEAVRTHLGMEVAYLSEFVGNDSVFRVVDAPGLEQLVKPGDVRSLDEVYCRHILEGRLPELIPDTAAEPICQTMPITQAVPIGAHISIPILLPDGEPYGMFCCLSPHANPSLTARDLNVMRLFADMAARQIGRDVLEARCLEEKRASVEAMIAQGDFHLAFQPIVDFRNGTVKGFESLCRFRAEPYRAPNFWFADAAEAGLGTELELAVIAQAIDEAERFPSGLYISINASPLTFCDPRLFDLVDGRDLTSIVFEITEHAPVDDYEGLRTRLELLRKKGARIAIDDAGAGFSSLRHIVQLHPDIIKLDMALTRAVDTDMARRALASALIYFAREIGASIVAEGIETEAELRTLGVLGISTGQGYFLGRPGDMTAAFAKLADMRARHSA